MYIFRVVKDNAYLPVGTIGTMQRKDEHFIFTDTETGDGWKVSLDELHLFDWVPDSLENTMTKKDYLNFHKDFCNKMTQVTVAKNADYTGTGDDPFSNFKIVEQTGVTDTYRGLLVRMTDKMSRLASFAQRGTYLVKDESVEDTLLDLANYCILTAGYLKSSKVCTNNGAESTTVNKGEDSNGI